MYCICPRAKAKIAESDCCATVLATTSARELSLCLRCAQGQRLASLSPYQPHVDAVPDDVARTLRSVLGYVLQRYPGSKTQGLRFLAMVAAGHYAYQGGAELLTKAAEAAGLVVRWQKDRPVLIINTAARKFAGAA